MPNRRRAVRRSSIVGLSSGKLRPRERGLHEKRAARLAEPLQHSDRTHVLYRGRRLSYFGGCDYFRLSSHPEVLSALEEGLRQFGLNVAASRMTTGNHALYEKLERRLARFFGGERAVVVSSGYATNLVVAQALAGEFSHALVDARAHASLGDAAQWLGCPVLRFQHRDAADAARLGHQCGRRARLILLSDGLFSHDGSLAPLHDYLEVLPADTVLLVDDAHAAGVIGRTGRGTAECLGVRSRRIVQTLTLSKAFGAYGGAILGSLRLQEKILARSHLFAGNTPLPLPLVCAALKALELLEKDCGLRQRLEFNIRQIKGGLQHAGVPIPNTPSPIVSWEPTSAREAQRFTQQLLAREIFPSLIRYPGGPDSGYFRFAVSSEHSAGQLDALLEVLLGRADL